jgi:hypothetical protein
VAVLLKTGTQLGVRCAWFDDVRVLTQRSIQSLQSRFEPLGSAALSSDSHFFQKCLTSIRGITPDTPLFYVGGNCLFGLWGENWYGQGDIGVDDQIEQITDKVILSIPIFYLFCPY